jgi:hypothetical protein
MFGFMKKGELKDRLRRRTADKLYDLARSAGRMPPRLPAVAKRRKNVAPGVSPGNHDGIEQSPSGAKDYFPGRF